MPEKFYEVETYWGWFRLDEGAFQDYLDKKLWITWIPPWELKEPYRAIFISKDGERSMCVELPVDDPIRVERITECVSRILNKDKS